MKYLINFFLLFTSALSYSVETLDIALESQGLKLEYIESSNRGILTPIQCSSCNQKQYEFTELPQVIKQGKPIQFDLFLKDYWNAKHTTIFLDPRTKYVIRVIY